jgi:hypothetical protein
VSASASASLKPLTVAVTMSSLEGATGLTFTVPVAGTEFATVAFALAASLVAFLLSLAVTSTRMASPRSPLPASARLRVDVVAPLIAVPLRNQRYW